MYKNEKFLLPFLFPFPSYVFLLYAIERWVTSLTNDDDPKVDFFFSQREKKEPISSKRLAGAASTVEVVWEVYSTVLNQNGSQRLPVSYPSAHTGQIGCHFSYLFCLSDSRDGCWAKGIQPPHPALCICRGCVAIVVSTFWSLHFH
jgi:hypothetical protein